MNQAIEQKIKQLNEVKNRKFTINVIDDLKLIDDFKLKEILNIIKDDIKNDERINSIYELLKILKDNLWDFNTNKEKIMKFLSTWKSFIKTYLSPNHINFIKTTKNWLEWLINIQNDHKNRNIIIDESIDTLIKIYEEKS